MTNNRLSQIISEDGLIKLARYILSSVMLKIRKNEKPYPSRWSGHVFSNPYRKNTTHITCVYTVGCGYSAGGGCVMCNFGHKIKENQANVDQTVKLFKKALNYLDIQNKDKPIGVYTIFTRGSFFDDNEVPRKARLFVYEHLQKRIRRHKKIFFATESRLEYFNLSKLKEISEYFNKKLVLRLGYGLESSNKLIREACINKNLPDNYLGILQALRSANVIINTHLLLKPPPLEENEAINDMISSIDFSLNRINSDNIVIMAMSSRIFTLVRDLENNNLYTLPSIWSIIEIIKRIGSDTCKRINFAGFYWVKKPEHQKDWIKTVGGCIGCSQRLIPLLQEFRKPTASQWNKLIHTSQRINCACKQEWQDRTGRDNRRLLKPRIVDYLDYLSKKYLDKNIESVYYMIINK